MPCARSLSASATTAMVAEGSMRLMRSVSFRASLVAVVMTSSSSFVCLILFCSELRFAARPAACRPGRVFRATFARLFLGPILSPARPPAPLPAPAAADVGIFVGRHHEDSLERGLELAVHQ